MRKTTISNPERKGELRFARLKCVAEKGGALLTVLWLSAGLTAIAFGLANSVRAETERASFAADGTRAYYLAAGSVERALQWMTWVGASNPDGSPKYYAPGMSGFRYSYPAGEVVVELIPEASKLNINQAPREDILKLFIALGLVPEQAAGITAAVIDWRTGLPPEQLSPFDQFYLSRQPSFRAQHASFEEIEELMMVQGMTPEIFHGSWRRTAEGQYVQVPGVKDVATVHGEGSQYDVNTASPAIFKFLGMPDDLITAILARRASAPFKTMNQVTEMMQGNPAAGRLRVGGEYAWTVRATATVRSANGQLSDVRRSVAALAKFPQNSTADRPYYILRWYDNAGNR